MATDLSYRKRVNLDEKTLFQYFRPDSASGMIAGMRPGSGTPFQPKTSVASFQSGAQEQKRTMEASHFGE